MRIFINSGLEMAPLHTKKILLYKKNSEYRKKNKVGKGEAGKRVNR